MPSWVEIVAFVCRLIAETDGDPKARSEPVQMVPALSWAASDLITVGFPRWVREY